MGVGDLGTWVTIGDSCGVRRAFKLDLAALNYSTSLITLERFEEAKALLLSLIHISEPTRPY